MRCSWVLLAATYLLVEKATATDATTLGGIKTLFSNPPRPVPGTIDVGPPGGVPVLYVQVNRLLAQAKMAGSGAPARRRSARMRATSSVNANGWS